jgi:hypothetical protein
MSFHIYGEACQYYDIALNGNNATWPYLGVNWTRGDGVHAYGSEIDSEAAHERVGRTEYTDNQRPARMRTNQSRACFGHGCAVQCGCATRDGRTHRA